MECAYWPYGLPGLNWRGTIRPMTLLGAVYLPNGRMACVSDRMHLRVGEGPLGGERLADGGKWMVVEGARHLLWGYAGSDNVGTALAPIVNEAASNWTALKSTLSLQLPYICARFGYPTDCLVAGWTDGVPGILAVATDGTARGTDQSPPADRFVGFGCMGVEMAWMYGTQNLKAERSAEHLSALMRLAIGLQQTRLAGFDRWEISPEDVPTLEVSEPVNVIGVSPT